MKNSKSLSSYEKKSWLVVIYCILAYTTVYIGRKNLSVCLPAMIEDGVITKSLGGTLGTCFLIFYATGQLFNGRLGDILHPRTMITVGLFGAGLMNIFMGLNSNGVLFCVFWAICGYSCSMLWSPIVRAVSIWTTQEISLSAAASLSTSIPLGTILCYVVCAACLKFSTWRGAFIVCGAILCLISVVIFLCFASIKEHTVIPEIKLDKNQKKPSLVGVIGIGIIFTAATIVFNGILKDGLDLWIPTILNDKFIPNASTVSLICSVLPIINLTGAYTARFIMRKFKLDELTTCSVMFSISVVCLIIVTAFISLTPSKPADYAVGVVDVLSAILMTVLFALSSAAMFGANTMLLTFIPLHYGKIGLASSVSGMLDCFSYAAAAVSNVAVGALSDGAGWVTIFIMFVCCAVVGALISILGHGKMKKTTDELDAIK